MRQKWPSLCFVYFVLFLWHQSCRITPFTERIFLFLCCCSLRLAVQEDLEEERREEEDMKRKKVKRQKTNWCSVSVAINTFVFLLKDGTVCYPFLHMKPSYCVHICPCCFLTVFYLLFGQRRGIVVKENQKNMHKSCNHYNIMTNSRGFPVIYFPYRVLDLQ